MAQQERAELPQALQALNASDGVVAQVEVLQGRELPQPLDALDLVEAQHESRECPVLPEPLDPADTVPVQADAGCLVRRLARLAARPLRRPPQSVQVQGIHGRLPGQLRRHRQASPAHLVPRAEGGHPDPLGTRP